MDSKHRSQKSFTVKIQKKNTTPEVKKSPSEKVALPPEPPLAWLHLRKSYDSHVIDYH